MTEKETQRRRRQDKPEVELAAMEKDGEKMIASVKDGNMIAVVSGMEIMYVFLHSGKYQTFIHKMEAEEGRFKSWDVNERNTAMLKNLPSAADQLFEIRSKPGMHYMGVMVAAEKGIIRFMDYIGILPAEDQDFMDWTEAAHEAGDRPVQNTTKEENE